MGSARRLGLSRRQWRPRRFRSRSRSYRQILLAGLARANEAIRFRLPFAPSRPQAINEPTSSYFHVALRPRCDSFVLLIEGSRTIALIRVVELKDEASAAATIAALRKCDPKAAIKVDNQRGLIDISSEVSVAELCAVLHDAGFIAAPMKFTPGTCSARGALRLLLRTFLFALPGAFGGIIVGVGVGVLNVVFNPECTSGGDEGACARAFR